MGQENYPRVLFAKLPCEQSLFLTKTLPAGLKFRIEHVLKIQMYSVSVMRDQ